MAKAPTARRHRTGKISWIENIFWVHAHWVPKEKTHRDRQRTLNAATPLSFPVARHLWDPLLLMNHCFIKQPDAGKLDIGQPTERLVDVAISGTPPGAPASQEATGTLWLSSSWKFILALEVLKWTKTESKAPPRISAGR